MKEIPILVQDFPRSLGKSLGESLGSSPYRWHQLFGSTPCLHPSSPGFYLTGLNKMSCDLRVISMALLPLRYSLGFPGLEAIASPALSFLSLPPLECETIFGGLKHMINLYLGH